MTRSALLLDLDGTLADSLGVMRDAYASLLLAFDRAPSEAEFTALNGPPLAECARRLKEAHALTDSVRSIVRRWMSLIEDRYKDVTPAVGARELLVAARIANWQTAVVTSGPQALARAWLRLVGLEPLVDVIVGGDDVLRGKPDPAPYSEAMVRLAIAPSDCIAVEDSESGAASAFAAGATTYIIQSENSEVSAGMRSVRSLLDLVGVVRRIGEVGAQ